MEVTSEREDEDVDTLNNLIWDNLPREVREVLDITEIEEMST